MVLGSAGVKNLDMGVMKLFARRQAKFYGIVYSWDNITTKFNYFIRFQRLAVWNPTMQTEAVNYLGYRPEQIAVIGVPQFDHYYQFAPQESREEFLQSLGLPPEARYVLYAGGPPESYPWGAEYAGYILKALPEHFVVVRSHPLDATDCYRVIEDHPRVRIFQPGVPGKDSARSRGFWLPQGDEAYSLAVQIFFAESIVTAYSTVTLDSLFLNRPVINITFDGCNSPFIVSMREYYETEHYRQITNSGAVPLVDSPAALTEALNTVDQWWPNRASQVRALKSLIDPFADGQAGRRLAEDILAFHQAA